jgi:hypothetical protein
MYSSSEFLMATAFRAAVMLAFLVGLPAAWIYYGPLPEQAQRTVDRLIQDAKEAVGWNDRGGAGRATGFATKQQQPAAPGFVASPPRPDLVGATAESSSAANPLAANLEPLLARLRELGVAGYALERWGSGGQWYRFHCEMPLTQAGEAMQQFEAVAVDPQATVEQVVAEVSSWRLARQTDGIMR